MEANKFSLKPTVKGIVSQALLGICCYVAFVIAIAVILSKSSDDCENPIREWLIVWIVVGTVSYLFLIISNIIAYKKPESNFVKIIKVIILLIGLFSIAWCIVGSVWLFTADGCEDGRGYLDNGDMYRLTLAILIMTYIGLGCCCCSLCCVFLAFCIKMKKFKSPENPPEPPNQE